jgi:hypothetical protein
MNDCITSFRTRAAQVIRNPSFDFNMDPGARQNDGVYVVPDARRASDPESIVRLQHGSWRTPE